MKRLTNMKQWALICSGAWLMGILPGCVEIAILRWSAPFLLSN